SAQEVAIKTLVTAIEGDEVLHRTLGKVHHFADGGINTLGRAESGHGFGFPGTGLEIVNRARLTETAAESLDVADQRFASACLRIHHKIGEGSPTHLLLRPPLNGLQAWSNSGLGGEGGEQPLRKAVDGLDS